MASSVRTIYAKSRQWLLGLCTLAMGSQANAQTYTPAGYDYLGSCNGQEYYISQAFISGLQISTTVVDFRTKTGLGPNTAYAAAIVNQAENTCVQNLMLAYNQAKYGAVAPPVTSPLYNNLAPGSKSNFPNWGDARNPWIGLTDASIEGTFVWSNGQPDCEDFRNWNKGEPNNFQGTVSNGEDFTQMLIMNPYNYDANFPNWDPLGKWNDWFNDPIITSTGGNLGPTRLPLIIEVGPAECLVTRGNLGCSHGYWKNASDRSWNEVGGLSRQAKFYLVFGITNGRGVLDITGSDATSMQQALELRGGGYNQVAKQGVAALMNTRSGFYPYSESEIKAAVQSMFNNGTANLPAINVDGTAYTGGTWNMPNGLASYLDMLNNLGCPINHHGDMMSRRSTNSSIVAADKKFSVSGYPNPTRANFTIQVAGGSTETVSIRVTDMTGRLVEQRTNLAANQTIAIGNTYRAGLYYVEVTQGSNKQQLKMVKQ